MDPNGEPSEGALPAVAEDTQQIIPNFAIDTLAHCLLPKMRAYFASPEGQAAFEAWKRQNADR